MDHSKDRMEGSVHLSEKEDSIVILDQRLLPNRMVYRELKTAEEIYDAIKTLAVRGAPAIGICAGYGMYVLAAQKKTQDTQEFLKEMEAADQQEINELVTFRFGKAREREE